MWIYGGFPESGYPNHPNLDHFSIETYGSGDPTFQETPIDFCISIILYIYVSSFGEYLESTETEALVLDPVESFWASPISR